MDVAAAEAAAKALLSGVPYTSVVPTSRTTEGYLESPHLTPLGKAVSASAPLFVAAVNAAAKGVAACCVVPLPLPATPLKPHEVVREKDKLLVAIDQLVASVTPSVDPAYVTASFSEQSTSTVCVLTVSSAAPAEHSIEGIVWELQEGRVNGRKGGDREGETSQELNGHFEEVLGKAGVGGEVFTLNASAVRVADGGWVSGAHSVAYLSTAEGAYVGQIVFTSPSSQLRRFERRLKQRTTTPFDEAAKTKRNPTYTQLSALPSTSRPSLLIDEPFPLKIRAKRLATTAQGATLYNTTIESFEAEEATALQSLLDLRVADGKKQKTTATTASRNETGFFSAMREHATPSLSVHDTTPVLQAAPIRKEIAEGKETYRMTVQEGAQVEFKSHTSAAHFDAPARVCINAFLNSHRGGRLFAGVKDNGTIEGSGIALTPEVRLEFSDTIAAIVNATRPRVPESLVVVRFHEFASLFGEKQQQKTISADWWKTGTPKGGDNGSTTTTPHGIVEVVVGCGKWPFYFGGVRSGLARVRGLASSGVLPETVLQQRIQRWAAVVEKEEGGDEEGNRRRRKRRKVAKA